MDELSFGEWKCNIGGDMDKLMCLEQKKRQLAERLFFLELHHQASLRQYQKILGKLGSSVPQFERRKVHEYEIPTADILTPPEKDKRVRFLKDQLSQFRACFANTKELLVLANHRSTCLNLIKLKGTECSSSKVMHDSNEENVPSFDELFQKRGEGSVNRLTYLAKLEKNSREIDLLKQIEYQLQKEARILCRISTDLVSARKWHLEQKIGLEPGPLAIYRECFSIC
jgi:hypothetical protein